MQLFYNQIKLIKDVAHSSKVSTYQAAFRYDLSVVKYWRVWLIGQSYHFNNKTNIVKFFFKERESAIKNQDEGSCLLNSPGLDQHDAPCDICPKDQGIDVA